MTASRSASDIRPHSDPSFKFALLSPGLFPSKTKLPLVLSGWIASDSDGSAPGVRVRIGNRLIHCQLTPDEDTSLGALRRHRFETRIYTLGGWKFLRFEAQSKHGCWNIFARRLVYVKTRRDTISYPDWLLKNTRLHPAPPPPSEGPLISMVVPVRDPESKWLQAMIESVRRQTYARWELCLADDASTSPAVPRVLAAASVGDARIKWTRRDQAGGASAATNSALDLATGTYCAFLNHEDLLAPVALAEIARAIQAYPSAHILYSDEDKIDGHGRHYEPHFKSSWNPDLLLGQNYFCHLATYRTELVRKLGGLRPDCDGAHDWDLALRAVNETPPESIIHIPRILYHWRANKGADSNGNLGDNFRITAARKSLIDHLRRAGIDGTIHPVNGGHWRIQRALPTPAPKVTIIIPTRNRLDLLRPCVESIFRQTRYPDFELLIVDNGSDDQATLAYLGELAATGRGRILRDDGPFNYSALNNRAARAARGSVLALLNNDIEPITPNWLTEMVSLAVRPSTGAVGAMLLYSDKTIQHAGVVLGLIGRPSQPGVAGHAFLKQGEDDTGYMNRLGLVQNYSAVTAACLVVRRDIFLEIGGFDEKNLAVAFNDVDLCLRLNAAGYRTTWTPFARLYHHESASRGTDDTREKSLRAAAEFAFMRQRWGPLLDNDPAYNPNLSLQHHDFRLSTPPRPPQSARTA